MEKIVYKESMMYETTNVINTLFQNNCMQRVEKISNVIKDSLNEDNKKLLYSKFPIKSPSDVVMTFICEMVDLNFLNKFENLTIGKGSDMEKEYKLSLKIKDRIVLLLYSPIRGSAIRIEDNNYIITLSIIREICKLYNEKVV